MESIVGVAHSLLSLPRGIHDQLIPTYRRTLRTRSPQALPSPIYGGWSSQLHPVYKEISQYRNQANFRRRSTSQANASSHKNGNLHLLELTSGPQMLSSIRSLPHSTPGGPKIRLYVRRLGCYSGRTIRLRLPIPSPALATPLGRRSVLRKRPTTHFRLPDHHRLETCLQQKRRSIQKALSTRTRPFAPRNLLRAFSFGH